jgi:putative acetyltransferase
VSTVVREAQSSDAERIAEIHDQSIRDIASAVYSTAVIEAWAGGKDPAQYPINDDGNYLVVAEHAIAVAGFGEFVVEADDYFHADVDGEIRAIYIHPSFTRNSIGTAIYTELEETAREHQVDSLGLWASINAVEFYESQGFEQVKRITHEFGGEVAGPAVEMKKNL